MKKLLLIASIFLFFADIALSQVSISNDGLAPDASAMLEIKSPTKGLLLPRITMANRPLTPPAGLTIYQTDNGPGLYYYDGTAWQKMGLAAYNFWNPSGADIYFSAGKVGIGTSSPDNFGLNVVNFIFGKSAVKGVAQIGQSVYAAGYLGYVDPSPLGLPLTVAYAGVLGMKSANGSNGAAVYGWNSDVNSANYGGLFYTSGTGNQASNYGVYSVARGGLNNYAGFYKGRFAVEGQSGTAAQDSVSDLFTATVKHSYSVDTKAITGNSAPHPGWGVGVEGNGGYKGTVGNSYAEGYYGWTYGLYGVASGIAKAPAGLSVRCGVYGEGFGGLNNYGGYFKGRVTVEGGHSGTEVDVDSTLFKAVVSHTDPYDTKAIVGISEPQPGYGYGIYGQGGYVGVKGFGNGGSFNAWAIGVYGRATGTTGTRIGIYGYAEGGASNWAGYFSGSTYISDELRIGTFQRATGYALSVNGKIACTEVLVQNPGSWPDYVFAKNYRLRSLEELERNINENGHLPGLPSAAEVDAGGFKVGEMQKSVVEKVEELTLYVIEQGKMLRQLQEKIDRLTLENARLSSKRKNRP